jgi:hypothetical protein
MQGTPDMYSCHPFHIPDSIPDEREFVGVRVGLDGASHLHHILLMECPGELEAVQLAVPSVRKVMVFLLQAAACEQFDVCSFTTFCSWSAQVNKRH